MCRMANFQPYDPHHTVSKSWRNLPHWDQPGGTYFITFRLSDSLSAEVRARMAELRATDNFEAFAWVDRYLDAGLGSCLLAEPENAQTVMSALRHFDGTRYHLGAFVVMPNHVHILTQPIVPHARTEVVHSWKSYTAHELQHSTGTWGPVWQDESFETKSNCDGFTITSYRIPRRLGWRQIPTSLVKGLHAGLID
jgi:hypothetical protein